MKVEDIIMEVAGKLDINLTRYNTDTLLDCLNFVLDELTMDYFPLTDEAEVRVHGNEILYEDFPKSPVYIRQIGWGQGKRSHYKLTPDRVILKKAIPDGYKVYVKYDYRIDRKYIEDDIEYPNFIKDALVCGVCSEWCCMNGSFDLAYTFSKMYRKAIWGCHNTYEAYRRRLEKVIPKEEV